MPPRIRSFLSRPPYKRDASAPSDKAPTVFREFVETLQRLDSPHRAAAGASAAMSKNSPARRRYGARPRKDLGNGHARPRGSGRVQ